MSQSQDNTPPQLPQEPSSPPSLPLHPNELNQLQPSSPPTVPGPIIVARGSDGLDYAGLVAGCLAMTTACIWCVSLPLGVAGLILSICSSSRDAVRIAGIVCSSIGIVINLVVIAIGIL